MELHLALKGVDEGAHAHSHTPEAAPLGTVAVVTEIHDLPRTLGAFEPDCLDLGDNKGYRASVLGSPHGN